MPVISVDIESNRPVIAANLEELRYLVFHGMKGDTGDSAYELAVELGFEGTEAEWLASLRGPQGEQGIQGEPGPRGEPGQRGETGPAGADGKNYGIVVDGSAEHVLELKSMEATGSVTSVNGKTGTVVLAAADVGALPDDLLILEHPADFDLKLREYASFHVEAVGRLPLTYLWQLSDDGGETWSNSSASTATYSTQMTDSRDGRMVRCTVTDANGQSETTRPAVMRLYRFAIKTQPVNFTGAVGAYARFEIAVIGSPVSYQWQYSDDGENWADSSVTAAVYTTMVTKGRAGRQVRCIVTDVRGDTLTSNAATIGVLGDVAVSGSYNDLSDKPSVDGANNAYAHLRSYGNSILTGSVWVNGSQDHLAAYDNTPYGNVATALHIPRANVNHTLLSDTGLLYDAGSGSFLTNIKSTDMSGFDYLLTHFWTSDMGQSYSLGSLQSTAGDGTLAGAVLDLLRYVKTSNSLCTLVLVSVPPARGASDVFTYTYGNGSTIAELDALMHELAKVHHFIYLDWQDMGLSYYYQDYTDGDNVHANSENTYRVMGEYLGRKLAGVETALTTKQALLTAGTGITIDSNNVISASGGGGSSGWVQLTSAVFEIFSNSTDATVEEYEAYYNADTGLVRLNLIVSGSGNSAGSVTSPTSFSLYFNDSKYYKPYYSGYYTATTPHHACPIGLLSVLPSTYGIANACLLYDTGEAGSAYSAQRPHIEVAGAYSSRNYRVYISGFYYTEDIPSS